MSYLLVKFHPNQIVPTLRSIAYQNMIQLLLVSYFYRVSNDNEHYFIGVKV